jgi:type VI protein secretion system component VasK
LTQGWGTAMHGRPVRVMPVSVTVAFVALAVALWALAWATTFENFDGGRGLTIEACGAGTATLLAWYSWQDRRQTRRDDERKRADDERKRADEDRAILIKTLADAVPSQPVARPLPFPQLPRAL